MHEMRRLFDVTGLFAAVCAAILITKQSQGLDAFGHPWSAIYEGLLESSSVILLIGVVALVAWVVLNRMIQNRNYP
jgi:hypothetical protein